MNFISQTFQEAVLLQTVLNATQDTSITAELSSSKNAEENAQLDTLGTVKIEHVLVSRYS